MHQSCCSGPVSVIRSQVHSSKYVLIPGIKMHPHMGFERPSDIPPQLSSIYEYKTQSLDHTAQ